MATDNTTITVNVLGSLTFPLDVVPAPAAGPIAMADALKTHLARNGIVGQVEEILSLVLAWPNPDTSEIFADTVFEQFDANGAKIKIRRIEIIQHNDLLHPFELQLAEGDTSTFHRYAFFATVAQAAANGSLWQRRLLDIDLSELPKAAADAPAKPATV